MPEVPPLPSELDFPHQNFGLSAEQQAILSEMLLNWGSYDFHIEVALYHAYKNISKDHAKLISTLEATKQLQILNELRKNGRLPALASNYLDAVNYSLSNYKSPRNIISHGIAVLTQDGPAFMKFDGKKILGNALHLYLKQSRYAIKSAYWMSQTIIGHLGPPPLPEKPPVEPLE